MWLALFIVSTVIYAAHSLQFSMSQDMPRYIEKALFQKTSYKPLQKQRVRTINNLTLPEVLDKIKTITRALNQRARRNGFKVDYKFRILGTGIDH